MRPTRALVAICPLVLAAAAACGGKVTSAGSDPGVPPQPGELEVLVAPQPLLDPNGTYFQAKIVARSGAFDVLAARNARPWGVVARRVSVTEDPAALRFETGDHGIVTNAKGAISPGVDGDLLAVCNSEEQGGPMWFTSRTGVYDPVTHVQLYRAAIICNSLAFHDGRGMLAVHKSPPGDYCCGRGVVTDITRDGAIPSTERTAFPEPHRGFIVLTAYDRGFAWAGFAENPEAIRVTFAPDDGPEVTHDIPSTYNAEPVLRIARWPFEDQAIAVSWQTTDRAARIVALRRDGTLPMDISIERNDVRWLDRPELAPLSDGLVVTYLTFAPDSNCGEVFVELRGQGGELRGRPVRFAEQCATPFTAVATLGRLVLAAWKVGDSYWGSVLRVKP